MLGRSLFVEPVLYNKVSFSRTQQVSISRPLDLKSSTILLKRRACVGLKALWSGNMVFRFTFNKQKENASTCWISLNKQLYYKKYNGKKITNTWVQLV